MPWKNCSTCGWSYNDTKGGCTNSACKSYDAGVKVGGSKVTPKSSPKPPQFVPSIQAPPSKPVAKSSVPDTPILPWINTPKPGAKTPEGVPQNAEPFTLVCYRGEKSEWWPEPRMRLAAGGMHVFEPWPGTTMTDIWKKLVEEVKKEAGFNVNQKVAAYAQYLRATGRPFALATARTKGGAFEGYSYVIEIENARTFRWGKDFTLGPPADFKDTAKTSYEKIVNQNKEIWWRDTIDADYIVLNADTIADSTILGFGHKTGTFEVTFLHDLPLSFVKSVNGAAPNALNIYGRDELQGMPDSPHKQTSLKLFRK